MVRSLPKSQAKEKAAFEQEVLPVLSEVSSAVKSKNVNGFTTGVNKLLKTIAGVEKQYQLAGIPGKVKISEVGGKVKINSEKNSLSSPYSGSPLDSLGEKEALKKIGSLYLSGFCKAPFRRRLGGNFTRFICRSRE